MCKGQNITRTSDLFPSTINKPDAGTLRINQEPELDTLLSRYILSKRYQTQPNGYRILIYRNSELKARTESEMVHAEFLTTFPDIPAYRIFQEPNYYLVLVGNFRSKTTGIKFLLQINKKYPYAVLVPHLLNFDDLNKFDSER